MPLTVWALLIVAAAVVGVLATRELLRRRLSPIAIEHSERVVPFLHGSVAGIYGLVAGFMLSYSWVEFQRLHDSMTTEVTALGDLSRIATDLPEPVSRELIAGVEHYLETVISGELALLAKGRASQQTTRALGALWHVLGAYHPETRWENGLRNLALAKLSVVGEQRRSRILANRASLPGIIWAILVGGGVVVIIGATVASLQYRRPAGVFLGALTAIIALVLVIIYALDQPFRYGMAAETYEYDLLKEMIRTRNL